MDLTTLINIIQSLPQKQQKVIMSVANFDSNKSVRVVFQDIIDMTLSLCRNINSRKILEVYRDVPVPDEAILKTFGDWYGSVSPLTFTDDEIEFVKSRVYRNTEGNFRLIPLDTKVGADSIPPEGLEVDEKIIEAELYHTRTLTDGSEQQFNGLKELQKQQYEPPYDSFYKDMSAALVRIQIQSTFDNTPVGFYKKDNRMYRNIISEMIKPDPKYIDDVSLRRAMFLMYLISGAKLDEWARLYTLIHYIVNVPNSNTGYMIYLNDFEAGGNGKSKFVSLLGTMFGDSFTAFEPHQLRFNMGLMGKRLVHISEFESGSENIELLSMIKSMTGRDKFQYEGKGMNPIVSDTHQNFVITSNRYIYFDDSGIKRRLQNFHCSNFLHILLNKHFKGSRFLDKLFGNTTTQESVRVKNSMANSLLWHLQNDKNVYDIDIKPQDYVLGNLNNPILRAMFNEDFKIQNHIHCKDNTTTIYIGSFVNEAQPKEINYASALLQSWIPELIPSRDNNKMMCNIPVDDVIEKIHTKLAELDTHSRMLKDKNKVYLEYGKLLNFDVADMLYEFFGDEINKANVPCEETEQGVIIL